MREEDERSKDRGNESAALAHKVVCISDERGTGEGRTERDGTWEGGTWEGDTWEGWNMGGWYIRG